jgi:hypothetical protein
MRVFIVLACLALSACAPGEIAMGKLPPVANAADAGEVVVIRQRAFINEEFPYYVNVDQENVLAIAAGQHARLQLPAGEHRIAIRCYGSLIESWKETVVTERVVAGQTRYLALKPKGDCVSLDPLPEAEARRLLPNTRFRPI